MTIKRPAVIRPDLDALLGIDTTRLAMAPDDVARLTRPDREARVGRLMVEAHAIMDAAVQHLVLADGRDLAATVLLFSGGNDSTVLGHLFKDRCTHAAHANTGVGIEATRQYVRNTCAAWGLPLLERSAPNDRDSYRTHVLAHGFPGTGMHPRIYQRLKERALRQARRELVGPAGGGHKARVVYVAGRRRTESQRRADVPELEREGATVWVSPIVNWTKLDMNTYRLLHADGDDPVPTNPTADLLHMSGECLCGCYAKQGEREQLLQLYPDDMALVLELEAAIADRDDIPAYARRWGWSWNQEHNNASRRKSRRPNQRAGYLCQSCETDTAHEHTVVT